MKTTTCNVTIGAVLALLWSMAVSWGVENNGYVQVWGGITEDNVQSVPPAALSNTTALAAGWDHCLALTTEGQVLAWGNGERGQTDVVGDAWSGVKAIAAGAYSSAAINQNGKILLWGQAEDKDVQKAFLNPPTNGPYTAVALGVNHGLAIREDDGAVEGWGAMTNGLHSESRFIAVAAGKEFSMGLDEDGQVFVVGDAQNWQDESLRINEIPQEISNGGVEAIAAGPFHAMALTKEDGCVWVWGAWIDDETDSAGSSSPSSKLLPRAAYGNVTNVPESAKRDVVAIAAGYNICAARKRDGSLVIWGNEAVAPVHDIPSCASKDVKEIVLGRLHAMARTAYLPPRLTTSELKEAYVGSEYTDRVWAIGDPTPTNFCFKTNTWVTNKWKLPNGLKLNRATGVITGTPVKEGTNNVTIVVTNPYGADEKVFTIVVHPQETLPPNWITESLPIAVVGTWYETHLDATGNPDYSVASGVKLPDWATLTTDGILKGWPDQVDIRTVTFIASNEGGAVSNRLTLTTTEPTNPPVIITRQGALPDGIKGESYSCVLDIQGATNVSLSSGQWPDGLLLQRTDGAWEIAGIPTTTGEEQEFELSASNPAGTTNGTWSIAVKGPPEWVTPEGALPSGRVRVAYTATVEANWATNYLKASAWPAGWTMSLKDGNTGKIAQISATPTATTNVSLGLMAVNAHGSPVRYFTVSVLDSSVPELSWTGIHCASNAVSLTWTNKTGGDSTAWIGTTSNLIAGWPTNTALAPPNWLKTNSPATLPAASGPHFYLLRAP